MERGLSYEEMSGNTNNNGSNKLRNAVYIIIIFAVLAIVGMVAFYLFGNNISFGKVKIVVPEKVFSGMGKDIFIDMGDDLNILGDYEYKGNGDLELEVPKSEQKEYKQYVEGIINEFLTDSDNSFPCIEKVTVDKDYSKATIRTNDLYNEWKYEAEVTIVIYGHLLQYYKYWFNPKQDVLIIVQDKNGNEIRTYTEKEISSLSIDLYEYKNNQQGFEIGDIDTDKIKEESNNITSEEDSNSSWDSSDTNNQDYRVFKLGEKAEFATLDATVTHSYASDNISGLFGTANAPNGTMFIVVTLKIENTTKNTMTVGMTDGFVLMDDKERIYTVDFNNLLYIDDADYYPELQPNVPKEVKLLFNVPNDVTDAMLISSHAQTGDIYALKIK